MRPRSLAPGLRCVVADNPGPLTLDGTCSWIVGRERRVIVDPGPDDRDHLERLLRAAAEPAEVGADRRVEVPCRAARPPSVEAVCLTHAHSDHAGAAAAAAERLGVPLRASAETLRRLGASGRPLADGDELPVDGGEGVLEALETPGHSRDHLAFLWRPARWLFTGDLVLGDGSSLIVYPDGDVGGYLASLARLIALRPRRLLPGHGPPVEDALGRLEAYRSHRLERDRQVAKALDAGTETVAEIRKAVYGPLPPGLEGPAELSVLAHLAHLRRGRALPPGLEAALEASAAPGRAPIEEAPPAPGTEGRQAP